MADLCELADVRTWLGVGTATSSDDALLSRLITATSADFLNEIDRYDFFAANFTDIKRGVTLQQVPPYPRGQYASGRVLILRHWPINSIASLTLDGAALPASADGLANGYYLDTNTDPENVNRIVLIGYLFTRLSTATIVYNAGYTTTPADVTQAVIEWVAARYRGRQSGGMSQIHIAEGRSQAEGAAFVPWDMPKSTQRVAERYKTNTLALMFSGHE